MTPEEIVGLLAEPGRLRVFSAVVLGAGTPSEVTDRAGIPPKEAVAALRRLQEGGLVQAAGGRLVARAGQFKDTALRAARSEDSARPGVDHGSGDPRVETLLRTFLRDDGGRIRSLPRQFGRRRIVLHHLARRSFETGAAYPEREVNAVLRGWCEGAGVDHVTVRRYLVDHCLLSRADGVYRLREDAPAVL
ncbi:DUF2087 domain-containing protein [Streptomyces sp. RKND-216]|uniref:DUF2087 domain-containing protein n=1 Tax=Streptomyces sp. RKND-216 TaxID=2562581 RepID=UPI00109DDEF9|nr:DUF2087 domain-containing protein [Streptomyces sp. RKND-216]THA23653.1 DUF2087 domain-containing protein [Streptomyces sp. RKND-216]